MDWSDEDTAVNPFSTNGDGNPFEDEPVSPTVSVPVRALYDYEGQEQDELSFKAGTQSMQNDNFETWREKGTLIHMLRHCPAVDLMSRDLALELGFLLLLFHVCCLYLFLEKVKSEKLFAVCESKYPFVYFLFYRG